MFFAPFVPFFDPRLGRPSTPMEVYLRLMFLKFRYRLGYESLCREVSDSITWRRFCRIPLDGQVPHPTTLMKLTTRCGTAAVDGFNEALLAKAVEAKVLRTTRLRADTTVVPANVAYPTDSGLLAKAVRRIAATGRRIQAAGGATRTQVRDRSRAAGARAHEIGAKLRLRAAQGRDEAQATVRRVTGELADLAERAAADAEKLLANARRALRRADGVAAERTTAGEPDPAAGRRRGRLHRAVDDLTELLAATRQIAAQTRQRLSGVIPDGATRRVSLHDGDARPIAKGRLGKPVEFGYKAQVVDNDDGVVLDHTVERGNPADAPQLAPAVEPGHPPHRASSADCHRRPRLRRGPRRERPARARRPHRGDPPQRQTRQGPPSPRTPPRGVPPNRQVANRLRRPDQHPQTRIRLGPHPPRRRSKEPGSGPDTGSWPTTWSRSPPSPPDHRRAASTTPIRTRITDVQTGTHRVLQVEVAIPDWHGCANRSRCTWWG